MAKKRKKKVAGMSVVSWVMVAVMAVALILSIVGMTTDWIDTKTEVALGIYNSDNSFKLEDLLEQQKDSQKLDEDYKVPYLDATNVFAWVTVIAVGACLALSLLGGLLKMNLLKTLSMIAGFVAIVVAITTVVLTSMMCKELSAEAGILGINLGKITATIATGCYLVTVGGIAGGLGAVINKFS